MTGPQRRERRRTHLDASVMPVEQALLHRAALVHATGAALPPGSVEALILLTVAAQFTEMAEELHWW